MLKSKKKRRFHCFKSPIHIGNVNIDKMVTSEENPCAKAGSKYFIGYKNNEDNTMLGILLQTLSGFSKNL